MPVKVQVGQQVIVTDGLGRAKMDVLNGTVAKVARVWIDVHREGRNQGWRFRLDTQTDGSTIGSPPRFYTLTQWATKLRKDSAAAYLREQGITIKYCSPWRDRQTELAKLMGWSPDA